MGILQWKKGFKSLNFYLKPQRLLVFFVWSKMAQGSLGLPVLPSDSERDEGKVSIHKGIEGQGINDPFPFTLNYQGKGVLPLSR